MGEVASIHAGTIPFYVEAPGARVSIQGLRFVRPKKDAILVYAVSSSFGCNPALGRQRLDEPLKAARRTASLTCPGRCEPCSELGVLRMHGLKPRLALAAWAAGVERELLFSDRHGPESVIGLRWNQ